jgi:DNA-binding transcriptional ArsR family regulator
MKLNWIYCKNFLQLPVTVNEPRKYMYNRMIQSRSISIFLLGINYLIGLKSICLVMPMKKILWWLIAGTKGGINRARIINVLQKRPYNAHKLAEKLDLDYKTVRHHIKVLEDNNVITASGEKYGTMYFLSSSMEDNFEIFQQIWHEMKED